MTFEIIFTKIINTENFENCYKKGFKKLLLIIYILLKKFTNIFQLKYVIF